MSTEDFSAVIIEKAVQQEKNMGEDKKRQEI